MIKRALLCVLLVLVPGCSILMPPDPAAPVAPGLPGVAYEMRIVFLDAPASSVTLSPGTGSVLPSDSVAGAVGIVGILRNIPYIGPMFFGYKAIEKIAENRGGNDGAPVTAAVFIKAIESGRVKEITYTPVEVNKAK